MRNAFASEICAQAMTDSRIVLLSGDIGNRLFDPLKGRCPDQFLNCGVAEANMVGVAAGLALSGCRPVVYTIAPFITARCLEQVRIDLCYHDLPVLLVGTGAGLAYASLGPTHHSCEDIAWLRTLPNLAVVCPADPVEVRLAVRAALHRRGPTYLRLGKKGEPAIHQRPPAFVIGEVITVREGNAACIVSTGNMLAAAVEAADILARAGMRCRVASCHTVKPLDVDFLADAFDQCPLVVTVEEHSRIGGLGSAVAEWRADQEGPLARLERIGTDDRFMHLAGDQAFAREQACLHPYQLARRIADRLGRAAELVAIQPAPPGGVPA
jgi:transketolase